MLILIAHPKHGFMHVYDNNDLERHKALGWSPVEAEVVKQAEVAKENAPSVAAAVAAGPEPAKKKPGPKPRAK